MWKRENLARHASTWKVNGVNSVDFDVVARRSLGGTASSSSSSSSSSSDVTVFTVDLHPERDKQAQLQVPTDLSTFPAEATPRGAGGGGAGGGAGGGSRPRG
jgi:hypothetical protein